MGTPLRLLLALGLSGAARDLLARPALLQPGSAVAGVVDIEVRRHDGTLVARWPGIGATDPQPVPMDSLPRDLVVRWRIGSGPWLVKPHTFPGAAEDTLGQAPLQVSLTVHPDGMHVNTYDPRPRRDEYDAPLRNRAGRDPHAWHFDPFPLLSLRAGYPGKIGLQAGLYAGWSKKGGGGAEAGTSGYGLLAAAELDLRSPSWRVGVASLGAGPMAFGYAALNGACRLAPWGASRALDCGPEVDLSFNLLHLRLGGSVRTGRLEGGLGFGL